MNKFQKKISKLAKKEQRDLYSEYEKEYNIQDISDCYIESKCEDSNLIEVKFTENGTNFLHAVATIPSYYRLKKKYSKLLKK